MHSVLYLAPPSHALSPPVKAPADQILFFFSFFFFGLSEVNHYYLIKWWRAFQTSSFFLRQWFVWNAGVVCSGTVWYLSCSSMCSSCSMPTELTNGLCCAAGNPIWRQHDKYEFLGHHQVALSAVELIVLLWWFFVVFGFFVWSRFMFWRTTGMNYSHGLFINRRSKKTLFSGQKLKWFEFSVIFRQMEI